MHLAATAQLFCYLNADYWEVFMSAAKLRRFCRRSYLLQTKQGRHLRLHRCGRVYRLSQTGALGDKGHMLLECSAFADLRALSLSGWACVGQEPAHDQQLHHCKP